MRVALLGPANSIHLQRWAHALVDRGHAVAVLTQHVCDRKLLPTDANVFVLPRSGTLGYFTNAWRARELLTRWRPDVVNAHYASGYGTTAALCGVRPVLLSVWGSDVYDFPYESALKGRLIRGNLRRATAIASTSHAMARQVRRLTPERREIAVTPFGVDLAQFAPAPHADRPLTNRTLTNNPLTLGTVKSLAPKYGIDLLLRAFAGLVADAEVHAAAPDCRLLIVGDGPQRAELEALAHELGIAPRTEFAGAVAHAEVPAWLNRLDVYAAPSRLDSESFGVAVIEAGACALPVVVSDAGGLPEVVRNGETGLIVARDDVPALQAALKRLVLDPALRDRLGRAGRVHVEREYEWGHCVDRMERCLQGLVQGGAAQ
ncbi:MAG: glycosyltransferase [Burkholderiales bacterium]